MHKIKIIIVLKIILLFLLFSKSSFVLSQNNSENGNIRSYIDIYGALGGNFMSDSYRFSSIQPAFHLGIQWKPNHILYPGIESGLLKIANNNQINVLTPYGYTNLRQSLSAIPIIANFTMRFGIIDVTAGMGISKVNSQIEAFGSQMNSSRWFYTYFGAIGYNFLFKKITIATRANVYSFPKLNESTIGISAVIYYHLISY